ncbi:uncharacterized protein LOC101854574 [Aplysia californica]|uniref:Uncharacterized protein LOC101854574 n=1 Tax=Aplysia californica TaxID=6500 RepID=A0ABM0JPV5_APLCA|nr:uncharacterized protein LOC101854574 [Aplysia californica]
MSKGGEINKSSDRGRKGKYKGHTPEGDEPDHRSGSRTDDNQRHGSPERQQRTFSKGDRSSKSPDNNTRRPQNNPKNKSGNESKENSRNKALESGGSNKGSTVSNRSNSQKPKNPDNKAALETIICLRNKLKSFKKKHMGASARYKYPSCAQCLEEDILRMWRMSSEKLHEADDFLNITLQKPVYEDIMDSDDYMDLITIAQREQEFRTLVPEVRRRLSNCLNQHVYKSCKSLKEESGDYVVVSAQEYESNISKYISEIEAKSNEIEDGHSSYQQMRTPFLEFVRRGEEHSGCMNKLSNSLLEACKIVETWVREDDEYPDKLTQEMESTRKLKENVNEEVEAIKSKMAVNTSDMLRLQKGQSRAGRSYSQHKRDRDMLRLRHGELSYKKSVVQGKLAAKQDERDRLKEERQQKEGMSPRESGNFLTKLENVERDMERLENERKTTERQMRRVEKELKPTGDKTYEQKPVESPDQVDYVECRNKRQELEKENKRLAKQLETTQARMADIGRQMETLRRMREMKLSPEAYRKGVRQRLRKENLKSNGLQTLTDACKLAAPSIGKDWKKLYLHLPFDPPRDAAKRQHDVDTLDYLCSRRDVTADEQALQSLTKWLSFHRRGNVVELIQTLKDMRKRNVAERLHDKFVIHAAA